MHVQKEAKLRLARNSHIWCLQFAVLIVCVCVCVRIWSSDSGF